MKISTLEIHRLLMNSKNDDRLNVKVALYLQVGIPLEAVKHLFSSDRSDPNSPSHFWEIGSLPYFFSLARKAIKSDKSPIPLVWHGLIGKFRSIFPWYFGRFGIMEHPACNKCRITTLCPLWIFWRDLSGLANRNSPLEARVLRLAKEPSPTSGSCFPYFLRVLKCPPWFITV